MHEKDYLYILHSDVNACAYFSDSIDATVHKGCVLIAGFRQ